MLKKKICFFITRLINGGAQKVVIDLLKFVDRDKFEITLLIGKTGENEPNLMDKVPDDIRVVRNDSIVREISPFKDLKAFFWVYRFFKKEKFDVVNLHTSKAGVQGAIAGKYSRIGNIVYTPHGHIFDKNAKIPGVKELSGFKMKFLYHLRKYAYKCCHTVVALSDEDKKQQVDLRLAPEDKFAVVFNGIDLDRFKSCDHKEVNDFKKRWSIENCKVIGSVGRLSEEKGHDILIKAVADMLRQDKSLRLLLVGEGNFRGNLEQLVEKAQISDQVVFTGNLDNPLPAFHSMDLFVLPSHYESLGLVLIEAMCAGVPVIASNTGGVPGVIEDGETGILVPPAKSDELSKAIRRVLGDSELRNSLISNASANVTSDCKFSKKCMLDSYQKLFER